MILINTLKQSCKQKMNTILENLDKLQGAIVRNSVLAQYLQTQNNIVLVHCFVRNANGISRTVCSDAPSDQSELIDIQTLIPFFYLPVQIDLT